MGKAPLAIECVGANPTDRGKNGRKRSLLVDERGVPLSLVASGANRHDVKLLPDTLDRTVVARPAPNAKRPQHLCADAGYRGASARNAVLDRNYKPHIKQRREEVAAKRTRPGYQTRRWVVERTHSWFNRFRKLLVSFEKSEASYLALLSLAAAIISWQQIIPRVLSFSSQFVSKLEWLPVVGLRVRAITEIAASLAESDRCPLGTYGLSSTEAAAIISKLSGE
jgi:putative transposase